MNDPRLEHHLYIDWRTDQPATNVYRTHAHAGKGLWCECWCPSPARERDACRLHHYATGKNNPRFGVCVHCGEQFRDNGADGIGTK